MIYLTVEQVLFLHSRIVDETGGLHGVRDLSLLQSAVERPKTTLGRKDAYPTVFSKAAALMESLACNHPFVDGNKRTAIAAAAIFLVRNGYAIDVEQEKLEAFTERVATRRLSFSEIVAWLRENSQRPRR